MQNQASIERTSVEQTPRVRFDEAGFEALFQQYQRSVYGWILRMLRNSAVAEDLTIETFWRIYRARSQFDGSREFGPWARRIASRVALDWLRSRRPETAVAEDFLEELPAAHTGDPGIAAEIREKVAGAMQRLPPKLRATALLSIIEERPHKEVADALGISVTAVKLRVFRALRLLRKDLKEQGITP